MGDKRTARWGERVFAIETTIKNDEIELTIEPTEEANDQEGGDKKPSASSRFQIECKADSHYVVAAIAPECGQTDTHPEAAAPVTLRGVRDGGTVWISCEGETYRLDLEDVKRGRTDTQPGVHEIRAPMTGTVLNVLAQIGDTVEAGEAVLVVEAMKMEHTLKAPRAGRIEEITCATGDQVEAQSVLVTFEEEPS